ncbi:MAG: hypothetical protein J0H29_15585 [Sphingobacteriales bacterium]|nr:hypothetical protein [Sphingobacteriales bacterium]OJY80793.1 MAG: hypothetical protein BGP14_00910 [Sphingobacteriales bacterium 44-15]
MKTYLLLRDNVETGPYTRERLAQMELRSFDLIWTIDESIVWKYPSEITEFKQFSERHSVTDATRVNGIKERQIRFFREYISDMDFRSVHIDGTDIPDALTNDIPAGYEYLVMADNYNRYGGSVYVASEDSAAAELQEENATADVKRYHIPGNEYFILGERQKVDTVEVMADPGSFTSYFTSSEGGKEKHWNDAGKEHPGKRRDILYSLTGLGMLLASLASYVK